MNQDLIPLKGLRIFAAFISAPKDKHRLQMNQVMSICSKQLPPGPSLPFLAIRPVFNRPMPSNPYLRG